MTGAKALTRLRSSSPRKKIRKRHASSPERVRPEHNNSPIKKKKRCIKPVWATSTHYDNEEHSESADDEIIGIRMVNIKAEPSQEGNIVPYMIQPMADLPIKTKKRKGDKKPEKVVEKPRSVMFSPIKAPDPSSPIRAPSPPTLPPLVQTTKRAALDIPVLGLSTYRINGRRLVNQAINASLEFGYRLFDTGAHYNNQRDLGHAFREYLPQHGLNREDIYIISKLDPGCMSYEDAMESVERSLNHLQTDYLDIILLYWPEPHHSMNIDPGDAMLDCYRALEDLYNAGKIRDIGAYKFSTEQLEYLLRRCAVIPAMLQAEFHPYLYRKSLVDICRYNSIRMQGFCFIKCVEDPVIISLSKKYRKAPGQIILRWIIQHGVGVLPKSKTPSHIKENANVFDFSLSPDDVEKINSLNQDRSFTPYSANHYKK
ncbi:glyoxal reductase-like [Bolinopsis microptera]|uniref:glyoxal reductase-like n=1 Tax=Bolinopsis microptera TaxID=2820187 RepID=UPI003078F769